MEFNEKKTQKFCFLADTKEPIETQIEHLYEQFYISKCVIVCNDNATVDVIYNKLSSLDHTVDCLKDDRDVDLTLPITHIFQSLYQGNVRVVVLSKTVLFEYPCIPTLVHYVLEPNDLFVTYRLDDLVDDHIVRCLSTEIDGTVAVSLHSLHSLYYLSIADPGE